MFSNFCIIKNHFVVEQPSHFQLLAVSFHECRVANCSHQGLDSIHLYTFSLSTIHFSSCSLIHFTNTSRFRHLSIMTPPKFYTIVYQIISPSRTSTLQNVFTFIFSLQTVKRLQMYKETSLGIVDYAIQGLQWKCQCQYVIVGSTCMSLVRIAHQ